MRLGWLLQAGKSLDLHCIMVTDLIGKIIDLLSRDDLDTFTLIEFVGKVISDPGIPMPIELETNLEGIQSASLARFPSSGLPYVLTLRIAADSQLTLATLKPQLGVYQELITDIGRRTTVLFNTPKTDSHWQVTVMAEMIISQAELEERPIYNIVFRRDFYQNIPVT
jgi:hypothetical protein